MRLAEREAAKVVEIRGSGAIVRATATSNATEDVPPSRVASNAPNASAWKQMHTSTPKPTAQHQNATAQSTAAGATIGEQKKNERVMEGSEVLRSVEKHIEKELSRPMRRTCETAAASANVRERGKRANATDKGAGKVLGKKKSSRAAGKFERVQHNRKDATPAAAAVAAATVAAADHSLYQDDAGLDDLDDLDDLEDDE